MFVILGLLNFGFISTNDNIEVGLCRFWNCILNILCVKNFVALFR